MPRHHLGINPLCGAKIPQRHANPTNPYRQGHHPLLAHPEHVLSPPTATAQEPHTLRRHTWQAPSSRSIESSECNGPSQSSHLSGLDLDSSIMSMSCGIGCAIFQKLCNVLLCGAVLAVVVAFGGAGSASGRCLCAWKSLLIVLSTQVHMSAASLRINRVAEILTYRVSYARLVDCRGGAFAFGIRDAKEDPPHMWETTNLASRIASVLASRARRSWAGDCSRCRIRRCSMWSERRGGWRCACV